MPRDELEDLTQKTFGDIRPVKYLGKKYWLCECKCGETLKIRKSSLSRYYIDYKCKHKESKLEKASTQSSFIDLTDKVFGDLSIKEYQGSNRWLCQCICGEEHSYESKYIRNNLLDYKCRHKKLSRDVKFIDLTDQQFGDLTVLEYLGDRLWKCRCSCGTELIRNSFYIRAHKNKCNHLTVSNARLIDLTNQQFGDMLVEKYIENGRWLCKCKCGYRFDRESKHIRNNMSNYKCRHLTGKRFGRLLVGEKLADRKYRCTCECGNIIDVIEYNLTFGHTKSCGCFKNEVVTSILDKEQVEEMLNKYISKTNEKPMLNQIHNILGVSYTTALSYIKRYELYSLVNQEFKSAGEKEIYTILKEAGADNIIVGNRVIINNNYENEIDIYLPDISTAIEFNGDYWHSDKFKDKYYHQRKTLACEKQGIRLIHIFEHELYGENTREKTISFIRSLYDKEFIYARNLDVTEDISIEEVKDFEESNHLQGYATSSINIALRDKNTKEVLGLMTLGVPRFNDNFEYEIIRLCFKNGIGIIGGAEKLFRYFVSNYNPKSILTYVDISKFTGNVYKRLGFIELEPRITEPSYSWIDTVELKRLSRYQTQKKHLIDNGLAKDTDTEDLVMSRLGYSKIFNSGSLRLAWYN